MSTPQVTWLLPVRNAETTLAQTLASIASQDYARHTVLAWDDGSTDATPEILKQWVGQRIPGQVISHKRVGIGIALRQMVGRAETELLARIDADDICESDRLPKQVAFLTQHKKVAVLGTQMSTVGCEGPITPQPTDDADIRWALRVKNPINHPSVMMRRSAVLEAGNYCDLRPGQDYDLWVRMAVLFRFANLPQALVRYRVHDDTISSPGRSDHGASFYRLRDGSIGRLLPGTEPAAARRLLGLIRDTENLDVSVDDLVRFRRAAMLAAQACRYSPTFFTETALFKQQYANLKTRQLKNKPALRVAWPLLKSAKSLVAQLPHQRKQSKRSQGKDQAA